MNKEKLQNFDGMINIYLKAIDQNRTTDKYMLKNEELDIEDLCLIREMQLIQMSSEITTCNEILGDNPNQEVIDNLEKMLCSCNAFKKINWPKDFTSEDIRKRMPLSLMICLG